METFLTFALSLEFSLKSKELQCKLGF